MDGTILSYTRGQVNAESLLREVHRPQEAWKRVSGLSDSATAFEQPRKYHEVSRQECWHQKCRNVPSRPQPRR